MDCKNTAGTTGRKDEPDARSPHQEMTRREYVSVLGAGAIGLAVPLVDEAAPRLQAPTEAVRVALQVNGTDYRLRIDPRVTLLDLLREQIGLTGTKKGCDHGQCGACTVLANGRRINSCLSLAVRHDGDRVITIEGLARNGALHPVQAAFIEHDGFQCGYCTPGQICSAVALQSEIQRGDASYATGDVRQLGSVKLTDEEIRERMSGNICRCGAYPGIVAAVKATTHSTGQASRSKE